MTMRRIGANASLVLMLGACGYDATPPDRPPDDAAPPAAASVTDTPAPGAGSDMLDAAGGASGHLTDASGAALYFLSGDTDPGRCNEGCQQVWPPVMAQSATPAASPRVQQALVGTLQVGQGGHHVTYQGHPLYRYAGDRGARTTTGHGVEDEWGRWQLMGVDGSPAQPPAASNDPAGSTPPADPARPPAGG
jgi:predicted lipoprotein with Yx(FWY)xxD motif